MLTIYKITISTDTGTNVNSSNVLFTIPKADYAAWQERIKQHIINRYKMPPTYSVDFAATANYKFAKSNYINLNTRRIIVETMSGIDAQSIDERLNRAIKQLSNILSKQQQIRLQDDLMLRWRMINYYESTK